MVGINYRIYLLALQGWNFELNANMDITVQSLRKISAVSQIQRRNELNKFKQISQE